MKTKIYLIGFINFPIFLVDDKKVVAIGVKTHFKSGYKIAHLYAVDLNIADTVFFELINRLLLNIDIYIDIFTNNSNAVELCKIYNFKKEDTFYRMSNFNYNEKSIENNYGINSFEL